jgi:5-methyltetrahydrofolate--homocysteine methyltransferase
MSAFLDGLAERVLLCDGAMGSRVQAMDLDVARDYQGQENCTEVLNLSRPDVVRQIHEGYFAAGADVVETNSFGGSPVTLAEFGLEDQAHEINRRAAELAREAAERFTGDGRRRFVLGAIGPGTRLPSLGHLDYDRLESAFAVQAAGLLAGGVDGLLIETCQDPLQIKAAVNGAKAARAAAGCGDLPLMVQVTVETTGTLLVGTDIEAAATVVDALGVEIMGLNCATGPQEMAAHLRWLGENWAGPISVQPNAGLPELVDGQTRYPLTPGELARWLERFLAEDGINLVGGCCGTTTDHIAEIDAMLRRLAEEAGRAHGRPAPVARKSLWVPGLASLYGQVPYRQENAYFPTTPGGPGLGRLRRHGGRAGQGRLPRHRRLHRLRGPGRTGRDGPGGEPGAGRRRRAPGPGLHRAASAGSGPEAHRRQAGPELHQLRGRRRAGGRSPGPGPQVR